MPSSASAGRPARWRRHRLSDRSSCARPSVPSSATCYPGRKSFGHMTRPVRSGSPRPRPCLQPRRCLRAGRRRRPRPGRHPCRGRCRPRLPMPPRPRIRQPVRGLVHASRGSCVPAGPARRAAREGYPATSSAPSAVPRSNPSGLMPRQSPSARPGHVLPVPPALTRWAQWTPSVQSAAAAGERLKQQSPFNGAIVTIEP